jgi:hypothetical protein
MRCLAFSIAWLVLFCGSTSFAKVSNLAAAHRQVLESERFVEKRTTRSLPGPVIELVAGPGEKMADPGQNWRATDVVIEHGLPLTRLVWAAIAGDYYVLHYEFGGEFYGFHVVVSKWKKGDREAKLVWHAIGNRLDDYHAFLAALNDNRLDHDPRNGR